MMIVHIGGLAQIPQRTGGQLVIPVYEKGVDTW